MNMQNQSVCKQQAVGINHFVRCLEENPSQCSYAVPLGSAYFCQSPYLSCGEQGSLGATAEQFLKNQRQGDAIAFQRLT
jgi:hypothetical protein